MQRTQRQYGICEYTQTVCCIHLAKDEDAETTYSSGLAWVSKKKAGIKPTSVRHARAQQTKEGVNERRHIGRSEERKVKRGSTDAK